MSTNQIPDVIYHYTSNDVFVKILDGKSLRMSSRHHLNDSMEGEQFFSLLKTHPNQPNEANIDVIRHTLDPLECFVTCFSSERDLLSQWRGYARNGTGVAIGFKKEDILQAIKGSREVLLYDVEYVHDFQDVSSPRASTINAILNSSGLPSSYMCQTLAKDRWAIKPKGFAEEKESRLIVTLDSSSGALNPTARGFQVGYFGAESEVREFCEFRFGEFSSLTFIDSIILGPLNRTDESALKRYLSRIGLGSVTVSRSASTYR